MGRRGLLAQTCCTCVVKAPGQNRDPFNLAPPLPPPHLACRCRTSCAHSCHVPEEAGARDPGEGPQRKGLAAQGLLRGPQPYHPSSRQSCGP